jgi:hypothetical protein
MSKLKVLSVGLNQLATLVRDTLPSHPGSRLWVATSYWDLCSLSPHEHREFHVAMLYESTSGRELRRKAEYIRRTWPDTVILLVADSSEALDDPFYDQRVPSSIEPCDLLTVIDDLTGRSGGTRRMSRDFGINADGGRDDA